MKINRMRSAAFCVAVPLAVCGLGTLQAGAQAETNGLSGTPQLVQTIANRSGVVVDRHRDQWAYQSLALLTRALLPRVCDSVQRGKELTRGEFARAVVALQSKQRAPDAATRQQWQRDGLKDAAGNFVLSTADFYGLLSNLESEFADELALLRVKQLGHGLSLQPVRIEPAHVRSDGHFPAIAELDKRLYPAVLMVQPRTVHRLEDSAIFIEYQPGSVGPEHRAVANNMRQQGVTCGILIGVGEPIQPLTLPAEVVQARATTYINRFAIGYINYFRLLPQSGKFQSPGKDIAQYVNTRYQHWAYEAALIAKLLSLRDNENTDLEVRILASHLAERLQGRAAEYASEANWAMQSIKNSRQLSSLQLAHLIDDLAAVAGQRMVSGSFLIGLLLSRFTRAEIRFAIIRGLQRSPFYLANDPDEELSTTIVVTYFKLLNDGDPRVRGSAAYGLSSMANDTWMYDAQDPDHQQARELTKRAQEAIGESIKTERDRAALLLMDNALEQMHRRAVYAHAA
jgi:hypothetical protein